MRTIEEALTWCMEHDVTIEFCPHGQRMGVHVYEYTTSSLYGRTIGFGKTFLEAVQEAAHVEANHGAQLLQERFRKFSE
jgi:hypothetical protein